MSDAKRKVKALVRADGAIALGETVGSIHRIGALAQGLEACNGWAFWHLETDEGPGPDRRAARRDQGGDERDCAEVAAPPAVSTIGAAKRAVGLHRVHPPGAPWVLT